MKRGIFIIILLVALFLITSCTPEVPPIPQESPADELYIDTFAGTGIQGPLGDGGAANEAQLTSPLDVAKDSEGNLYITDTRHRVKKVDSNGIMSPLIGPENEYGDAGYSGDGGFPENAQVNNPEGILVDSNNNIYIVDSQSKAIRFIPKNDGTYFGGYYAGGRIHTILGSPSSTDLADPMDISIDSEGNIYITDYSDYQIKKYSTVGTLSSVIGSGENCYPGCLDQEDGLPAETTSIGSPRNLAIDSQDNIYWTDNYRTVRMVPKIDGTYFGKEMQANHIYFIAGEPGQWSSYSGEEGPAQDAHLVNLHGIDIDQQGNLYIVEYSAHSVLFVPTQTGTYFNQQMTANYLYRIAGTTIEGYTGDEGLAIEAQLSKPIEILAHSQDEIYIADHDNHVIRLLFSEDSGEGESEGESEGEGEAESEGEGEGEGEGENERCGDNEKNRVSEECDGADLNYQTCITKGYDSGILSCTDDCTFNTSDCTIEDTVPPQTNNTDQNITEETNLFPVDSFSNFWVVILLFAISIIAIVISTSRKKQPKSL